VSLRTRAISLSLLPVVITLLFALPEAVLQVRVGADATHARHTQSASVAARDIGDSRALLSIEIRRWMGGDASSQTDYIKTVHDMRVAMDTLEAVAGPEPEKLELARRINANAAKVLADFDGIQRLLSRGLLRAAAAAKSAPGYFDDSEALEKSTREFVTAGRAAQDGALRSFQNLANLSILLLSFALAGLLISSGVLWYNVTRAADMILELVRKAELYRNGAPLSEPSQARDEIGLLDAGIHEFVTVQRRAAEQTAVALDQALDASRLKSEFVATMSHEIRTPMHGVIGMSELLLETQLLPAQREYAVTVKESAQALLAIIDDILDFSKLDANKIELEDVAFDPAQLAASAMNLARGAARDKGLAMRSSASPHVPAAVRGDPTRLRQILINLIGNAVKFTAAGEVTVETSVERDDGRSVVLAFSVCDTGIGVAPEARERLFEAFVQGDGSTTRRFGGTGLGLSISRRLVELMGGRIWVDDHEGPGSTFSFTARFERTSEILVPATPAAEAIRVLVLDDDKGTRNTFETILTGWGMHNASSADIDSARVQLREAAAAGTPYDVVLIDYVLPRSDGLAFAAELGEHAEYGNPARILMTAFDAVGRKEAALAAGCVHYLPKPVDPSDLYDSLGEIERARKTRLATPGNGQRRARILMAEDSALIRRVAGFQLAELEYAVDIVENGMQAVAAVAGGAYELVLMDMRMPEMDGLAATRAIRIAERTTGLHVVVIALTANVLEGDREACVEAGMDDFLAKPLNLDALGAALERWLPAPA
jgi:two-component system, sensor histidine kinase and response regulator